ncbi:MAG TPA: malto-oligosyltrehalose trehalohydrolase [Hyphomicrobiales bacterium]|nr:malto-oligosyltrehalose trehalohydrolase [Hyphomicrobiales bacterium]
MTASVHAMPFGAAVTPEGVRFALWAPSAKTVALLLDGSTRAMSRDHDGWWRAAVPGAGAGSRYAYVIDGAEKVPDPASRFQPDDVFGPSMVIDPAGYDWQDGAWRGRAWEEAVLYEVHVGTATPEGTFAALTLRLPELADLGVTAIELMPLSDFAGARNWGYDGVLPFAPDSAYGTPDDLKRLVDRAHGLGLMVFFDVVYNHFGPAGNHLGRYAAPFFTERHHTPWGAAINFDGEAARPVRDLFVHNALYWLEEFHGDGLRFDAVHAIADDSRPHILAEIATSVRAALPGRAIHLVLENDRNEARWLSRGQRLFDAQWADDVHHAWHVVLTGEREGYYEDVADDPVEHLGRALAEGFAWQGEPSRHRGGTPRGEVSSHLPPSAFVAFLQNHDQVGNRALGERLAALAAPQRLALARAVLLLAPQIPLLFMGEEWDASTPFRYFVDFAHDDALAAAVRDGRRREFARFAAFAGGTGAIPDPTAEAAFHDSRLDWDEAARAPHATVRAEVRRLLALRREAVLPLTRTDFLGAMWARPTPDALDVTWRFADGTLRLTLNFGNVAAEYGIIHGDRPVWSSPAAELRAGAVALPPWTGALFRGA